MAVSENTMDVFANYDVYSKEIEFYGEVAPKINQKLRELGEQPILPEIFGVCKTRKIMIMDDLAAKGYKIIPAQPGYDIPQAKIILKKMAMLHSICAILQEEQPNILHNFKSGQLIKNNLSYLALNELN